MLHKFAVIIALSICTIAVQAQQTSSSSQREDNDRNQRNSQSISPGSSSQQPGIRNDSSTSPSPRSSQGGINNTNRSRSGIGAPGRSASGNSSSSQQPGFDRDRSGISPGASSPSSPSQSQDQSSSGRSRSGIGAPGSSSSSSQSPGFDSTQSSQPRQNTQDRSVSSPGSFDSRSGIGAGTSSQSGAGAGTQNQTGRNTQPGALNQGSQQQQTGRSATPGATPGLGRPGAQQQGQSTVSSTQNININNQNVTQLQTAFSSIRQGAGEQQKQQLTQTIMAMAPSGQLSQEYVTRFVTDVTTILPRVTVTADVHQRLAMAVAQVLTPNIQPAQLETTLTQVRQVLANAGLQPIAAQTIACDLHLLAAQTHPDLIEVQVRP